MRRFKKKRNFLSHLLVVCPAALLLSLTVFFLWDDEFMLYTLASVKGTVHAQQVNPNINTSWHEDPMPNSEPTTEENVPIPVKPSGVVAGQSGLKSMYINAMHSGYYREMLTIISSHLSNENMPSYSKVPTLKSTGKLMPITVQTILGMSLVETGVNSDKIGPRTQLGVKNYKEGDSKYSLYNFNTNVAKEDGLGKLGDDFRLNLTLSPYAEDGYRGPFQWQQSYFKYYPSHTNTDNSKLTNPCSRINGYKNGSGERGPGHNDAASYPDAVAFAINYACDNIIGQTRQDTVTEAGIVIACYAMHNGGPAAAYPWGTNSRVGANWAGSYYPENTHFKGPARFWHEKNTVSVYDCVSASFNYVGAIAHDALMEFANNFDTYKDSMNYFNSNDYRGFATVLLLGHGGFIATDRAYNSLWSDWSNPGIGDEWRRGALTAYKFLTDNPSATMADVESWLRTKSVKQTIDESFYGYPFWDKNSDGGISIHFYNEDIQVYNMQGEGPRPVLHTFLESGYTGGMLSYIAGYYSYWKMLNACGVVCTFPEAVKDGLGLVTESYYTGTRDFVSFIPGSDKLSYNSSAMTYRDFETSEGIHYGEDYQAVYIDLAAVASGTVRALVPSPAGGAGNTLYVTIDRLKGEPQIDFIYQHLSELPPLKIGDRVEAGQIIAKSGKSPASYNFAPHLHLGMAMYPTWNSGQKYFFSFRSVFEKLYPPSQAPLLISSVKKVPGRTYDKNGKFLGNIRDTPHMIHAKTWDTQGINSWLDQALAAP